MRQRRLGFAYSHSIVPGGLLVMSYVTRLMPRAFVDDAGADAAEEGVLEEKVHYGSNNASSPDRLRRFGPVHRTPGKPFNGFSASPRQAHSGESSRAMW